VALGSFLACGDVSVGGFELDINFWNSDFDEPKVVDEMNLRLFSL
jgi:hypothetical protein